MEILIDRNDQNTMMIMVVIMMGGDYNFQVWSMNVRLQQMWLGWSICIYSLITQRIDNMGYNHYQDLDTAWLLLTVELIKYDYHSASCHNGHATFSFECNTCICNTYMQVHLLLHILCDPCDPWSQYSLWKNRQRRAGRTFLLKFQADIFSKHTNTMWF